jgi:SAM-dependent methyltransferase
MKGNPQPPDLDAVYEIEDGAWKAAALKAAIELEVFAAIGHGATVESLVSATGCDARGLGALLGMLCSLGLVRRRGHRYTLEPVAATYLLPAGRAYYGEWALRATLVWDLLGRISEAVRLGEALGGDLSAPAPDSEATWAAHTTPILVEWPHRAADARKLWALLAVQPSGDGTLEVLDAACGPGVTSLTLALDNPGVRVTALDSPNVLQVTRAIASEMGVGGRVTPVAGDVATADFGTGRFDVVLFGRILYYFAAEDVSRILCKALAALKPGGLLVIHETLLGAAERSRDERAPLAALMLFMFAPRSCVRTFAEYRDLLGAAGFVDAVAVSDSLIRAVRPR